MLATMAGQHIWCHRLTDRIAR